MATKQFLTLEGLTTYDGLIKQYIGTEDAKSIKSLTVSGNTVSFYKTADASGTAAYTVNMPDVSGFMSKIAEPSAGSILVSDANGNAVEDESLTGYAVLQSLGATTGFDGSNTIADALDDLMPKGDWSLHGYVVGTSTNGEVYDTEVGVGALENAIAATAGFNDQNTIADAIDAVVGDVADKIDKIASATGGKIVTSTAQGQIAESDTAIADLATQSDLSGKMDKGIGWGGDKVVVSDSYGNVSESGLDINSIVTYDAAATGYIAGIDVNSNTVGDTRITTDTLVDSINATTGFDSDNTIADFIGSIPQGASASTVVGYIDEAVADAAADADISLVEAQTPTTGYLKTYELYQGGNAAANLVGKIDIPKDLVVTSGEIVVNPAGQPAGTYLKLTIANQTAPVYINVADLADVYTAASGATQVQLAISATNEISATLVAGGVGATELASNAVTTAKIADDAVTADKVAISAHTEAQTAGSDGVAISVTTTDGQVSAVSASIAANTYDTYGAASGVQTSLVGTSSDPASADTINGAKAYADAATASIPTASIEALFA